MATLVLLPGLDGTGLLSADLLAALDSRVRAVVASYPTDLPLGYAELEPITRSFLPRDEPYFLLGESFSGPLAISIAASRPSGLLGLILCCSFARYPWPAAAIVRPLISVIPVAWLPSFLLNYFLLGRFGSPALCASLAEALAGVSAAVLRARARAVLSVDVSTLLLRIEVPMLYLRASADRVVPKSCVRAVASRVPTIQVVEFQAPHLLLQVLPLAATRAIGEFMRGAGSGEKQTPGVN